MKPLSDSSQISWGYTLRTEFGKFPGAVAVVNRETGQRKEQSKRSYVANFGESHFLGTTSEEWRRDPHGGGTDSGTGRKTPNPVFNKAAVERRHLRLVRF